MASYRSGSGSGTSRAGRILAVGAFAGALALAGCSAAQHTADPGSHSPASGGDGSPPPPVAAPTPATAMPTHPVPTDLPWQPKVEPDALLHGITAVGFDPSGTRVVEASDDATRLTPAPWLGNAPRHPLSNVSWSTTYQHAAVLVHGALRIVSWNGRVTVVTGVSNLPAAWGTARFSPDEQYLGFEDRSGALWVAPVGAAASTTAVRVAEPAQLQTAGNASAVFLGFTPDDWIVYSAPNRFWITQRSGASPHAEAADLLPWRSPRAAALPVGQRLMDFSTDDGSVAQSQASTSDFQTALGIGGVQPAVALATSPDGRYVLTAFRGTLYQVCQIDTGGCQDADLGSDTFLPSDALVRMSMAEYGVVRLEDPTDGRVYPEPRSFHLLRVIVAVLPTAALRAVDRVIRAG